MATIMPNTSIILCKDVPLDATYEHTVSFANASAAYSYFYSKRFVVVEENSYQRVLENKLRIACTMEQAIQCNYMMFKNTNFENKWIYAFITGWQYINNATTEITYEIDVFQTFWNDTRLLSVFVEREHSVTDAIGANTVPEALEQGEYILDGMSAFEPYTRYEDGELIVDAGGCAIFYCTFYERPSTDPQYATDPFPNFMGGVVNGSVYTGLVPIIKSAYRSPSDPNYGDPSDPTTIDGFLAKVQGAAKKDGIIAAYICPFRPNTYEAIQWQFNLPKHITTLAGYTPKNKKLLTYPYNVLRVRTDSDSTIYRWEFFSTSSAQFTLEGYIVPDPCLTLIPANYNATTERNYCVENRLTIKEFPQVAIDVDVWKVYYAQHGASLVTSMIGDGLGVVGGVASAVTAPSVSTVVGAASSVVNVAHSVAQLYEINKRPPELKGTQTSMADYAIGAKKFYADNLCIRPEYARIIDDYFNMFGYATKRVKVPNLTSRPYWNYVKTVGHTVDGISVPDPFIQRINNAFNNGITIWHNPDNVGNYTLDNSPQI